eukprot:g5755.t1
MAHDRLAATRTGDQIDTVGAYRLSYVLRDARAQKYAGSEARDWRAEAVEQAAWDAVVRFAHEPSTLIEAQSFSIWAFDNAAMSARIDDSRLVLLSYLVLTAFASAIMYAEFEACVLGPVCVVTVVVSVVASFGFVIACGQTFNIVVVSVIFVLLGLGVDDAFVIMASLRRQPSALPQAQRISQAVAVAGGSIMLTSFTDLFAFLVGASTVIPAISSFCVFAGVAVLFDFILQVTIFIAAIVLLRGRNCCCARAPVARRVAVAEEEEEGEVVVAAAAQARPSRSPSPTPSRMQWLVGKQLPRKLLTRRGKTFSAAGARYTQHVKFDASGDVIVATRVPALIKSTSGIQQELDIMARTRAVADDPAYAAFDGTVYMYPFLFWEGLAVVEREIVRNILIAAVCVFVVCWLMLASLPAAAIVLCVIAMIDVCLLGCMHAVGDSINMITAINLLLAIGLCIDYSAHVCHAFLMARGTRDERAAAALEHIGLPVFYGALSTLLAALTTLRARSYIFQSFGRMFILIVVWGLYFGLVVLPVFLSIFGPASAVPPLDAKATRQGSDLAPATATHSNGNDDDVVVACASDHLPKVLR